jgi:hypothetical protein
MNVDDRNREATAVNDWQSNYSRLSVAASGACFVTTARASLEAGAGLYWNAGVFGKGWVAQGKTAEIESTIAIGAYEAKVLTRGTESGGDIRMIRALIVH